MWGYGRDAYRKAPITISNTSYEEHITLKKQTNETPTYLGS